MIDVFDRQNERSALPTFLDAGTRHLPTTDAELDQVAHVEMLLVGGPVKRRRVHPLVEVILLCLDVAVEVDDADLLAKGVHDPTRSREADGVVATQDDRKDALASHVLYHLGDLVEALLDVCRDGEDVPDIDHVELLSQVNPEIVVVGSVQPPRCAASPQVRTGGLDDRRSRYQTDSRR
jgi:hypothetical protein